MEVKMLNLAQFNQDINKFRDRVPKDIFGNFILGLAMKLLRGIVLKTPVDTGRARANWQVNIGSITSDEVEQYNKSDGDADRTIERGAQKIESLREQGVGQIIYIYNNVHYIVDLENGTSSQAPSGMVAVTFAEIAAGFNIGLEFTGYAERIGD
jgi:hypothetical protein